jgi:hypothetical protein
MMGVPYVCTGSAVCCVTKHTGYSKETAMTLTARYTEKRCASIFVLFSTLAEQETHARCELIRGNELHELFGCVNGNANVNEIDLRMLPAGMDLS